MLLNRSVLHRSILVFSAAAVASLSGGNLAAAEARTEMAPFRVEAEFGIDGLRFQNSNAVLNDYLLGQHGVTQLQDISGIAPNLFSSNSDTRGFGDVLSLRGVANSIFFSPPSIALYVDDVPSGSVSSYPSSLLNIDSFSVKAGPQGFDYGRSATGGVIDIRTRVPGVRHQGRLLADYGSFNAVGLQAAFDGPLTSEIGYSASVGYNEREGYIDNTFTRRTADDRSAIAGRGSLFWKPTEGAQLRFGMMFERVRDDDTRLSSLLGRNRFQVASDVDGETNVNRSQFSFQWKQAFDWGAVVATTSRQDWDLDPSATDLDLSPLPLGISRVTQNERLWTQEVRFESKPASGQVQWRAGVFWLDSATESGAFRQFVVPPSQFVPPGFVQTERTAFDSGQSNLAFFGSVDQPISKATTLKFGLRLERADADIIRVKASSNNFGFPSPQDPRLDTAEDDDFLSGSFGLVHVVSDSVSVQAKSSLAHKPGGFSGFTSNPRLARFEDERIWANEIGVTFGPPQGRFGASLLGFWNRMRGYQFERTVPNSTDYVVVNADEVTALGFEAKFMWNPVERVWWDFQAGYTRAEFDEHRDSTGNRVSGNSVPFVPRSTLRTGVTVDFGHGWSANASYGAIGRTFFDERNTGFFAQAAYGLVNAQVRYRIGHWGVTVYGHNLFEKEYYQFINPEIAAGSPGAPRRIGVQVSVQF
jgi:outer membrane receptor protein involved in Fe transport